ncbi:DNA mismatch repair protein MutS, partial [Acrasis kona]
IIDLPHEALLHVFHYLVIEDLRQTIFVCKDFYKLHNSEDFYSVWKTISKAFCEQLVVAPGVVEHIDLYHKWRPIALHLEKIQNADYQQKDIILEHTLIAEPIRASTIDYAEQDVDKTRDASLSTFWSSKGSDSEKSNETTIYSLVNPEYAQDRSLLCSNYTSCTKGNIGITSIKSLLVKFFEARYQFRNIYASRSVRVSITDQANNVLWSSEEIKVNHSSEVQEINCPVVIIEKLDKKETIIPKVQRPDIEHFLDEDDDTDMEYEDEEEEENTLHRAIRATLTHEEVADAVQMYQGDALIMFLNNLAKKKIQIISATRLHSDKLSKITSNKEGRLLLRVDYLGKIQKQPGDELYYTCVEFLDLVGDATTV